MDGLVTSDHVAKVNCVAFNKMPIMFYSVGVSLICSNRSLRGSAIVSKQTNELEISRKVDWEFPGWGTAERIDDLDTGPSGRTYFDLHMIDKLGEWKATAICGNDITSSCLYVVALCSVYAGPFAPLALGLVALVLYLFRKIYSEVGTALPLNGGAYNALLNTTTKAKASVAACLTLLSYIATAVSTLR